MEIEHLSERDIYLSIPLCHQSSLTFQTGVNYKNFWFTKEARPTFDKGIPKHWKLLCCHRYQVSKAVGSQFPNKYNLATILFVA